MIGQRFLFAFETIGGINLADHFLKHMRKLISLIVKAAAVCLCVAGLALPGLFAAPFDRGKLAEIDAEIEQAIVETNLPGAVLWIEHKTIRFHKAYGNRATLPKTAGGRAITMIDGGGQPLAEPSALGGDGASFSVRRTGVPSPAPAPGGDLPGSRMPG